MEVSSTPDAHNGLFSMSTPRLLVGASLLSSDLLRLGEEVRRVDESGVDWLHIDVMDGRFVDNFAFSPAMLAAVRSVTAKPLQAHLMLDEPRKHVARFIKAGALNVTVHVEARDDLGATIREIREAGAQPGLALNPATPFEAVESFLPFVDLLLVMTVHPGFGGQEFITETMQQVAKAARARRAGGLEFRIQVDGGINSHTALTAVQSGADFLVCGSYLLRSDNIAATVKTLRDCEVA